MKKVLMPGVVLVAALLLARCGGADKHSEFSETVTLDTVAVTLRTLQSSDFTVYGDYYGSVHGSTEADLVCFTGGRVNALHAREGSYVKTHTSLADIDAENAETLLQTARLQEKVTRNALETAEAQLTEGTASPLAVDQARLAWLGAKKQRIDAEKNLRGARAMTPVAGMVTARYVDLYQELAPGTPTFTVAQISRMRVRINIPESEISGISEGNHAVVTFSSLPGDTFSGQVTRLSRSSDFHSRTFIAEITFSNPQKTVKPGLTANVTLERMTLTEQFVVPTSMVLTRDEEQYIMVARNGKAERVDVTRNATDGPNAVLSGKKLENGISAIDEGSHMVTSGTPLKIMARN